MKFSRVLLAAVAVPVLGLSCTDGDPVAPEAPTAVSKVTRPTDGRGAAPVMLPMRARTAGMMLGIMPAPGGRCPEQLPLLATYGGEGNATHMGRISVQGSECLIMDPNDPTALASGEGEYTLIAANGDELYVAYDRTTLMPEGPDSSWILWSAEIYATGGTGRFEAAELSQTVWKGGLNLFTYETWSEMDGWIRLR